MNKQLLSKCAKATNEVRDVAAMMAEHPSAEEMTELAFSLYEVADEIDEPINGAAA